MSEPWHLIPEEYRPRLVVADNMVELFREAYGPSVQIIPVSETYLPAHETGTKP